MSPSMTISDRHSERRVERSIRLLSSGSEMTDFDFAGSVRWAWFDPQRTLSRRNDDELPFLGGVAESGRELMLDTCVYIDGLQGRAPDVVADLLDLRLSNH